MRCDEFQAAILAGEENGGTAEHEAACARCRAEAAHMRATRAVIADSDIWEPPSPNLRGKVVAAVASEASLRLRAVRRRLPWIAAVAALAVVIVGLGAFLTFRNPPDWEVAMSGTQFAPLASGTVLGWNGDAGTRMVLDVTGLDAAPPGYVYEMWLSAGARHISAGTFVEADHDLELWAGVSRRQYPRVWITLEPLDDDESLSGQTVLDTGA